MLFKKIDHHDYNLEDFEDAEYNEFETDSEDNVLEIASNKPIGPATSTDTSNSTSKTPKIVRFKFGNIFDLLKSLKMKKQ